MTFGSNSSSYFILFLSPQIANDLAASNDFKSQLKVPIMFNNVKTSLENFYSILASYNIGRHQQHID
jgi:hypothetical protein